MPSRPSRGGSRTPASPDPDSEPSRHAARRAPPGAAGPWFPAVRAALALAALLVVPGCGAGETAAGTGQLRVVATTGMIADAAARVGGERVVVDALMGPGIDPHLYRASAADVRRLAGADLILYNGLHLEAALAEVLEEMGQRRRTVAVTGALPRDTLLAPPEFAGSYDPHVWFDVGLWRGAVARVAEALAEADPAGAGAYGAAASAYLAELSELDAWVRQRAAELPPERRVLITAHDAFGYFGRAYGFEVMGLQGISTTTEAGTADVQRLAATIVERRIPAIFVESSIPRRTLEAVQAAVRSRGQRVAIGGSLFSDAMGDAGTPEGTYPGMVRHNVNTIIDALRAEVRP
jgi:manganese/zinc/iron transport system substrate-binding protein